MVASRGSVSGDASVQIMSGAFGRGEWSDYGEAEQKSDSCED
jgi:hypothetical protein